MIQTFDQRMAYGPGVMELDDDPFMDTGMYKIRVYSSYDNTLNVRLITNEDRNKLLHAILSLDALSRGPLRERINNVIHDPSSRLLYSAEETPGICALINENEEILTFMKDVVLEETKDGLNFGNNIMDYLSEAQKNPGSRNPEHISYVEKAAVNLGIAQELIRTVPQEPHEYYRDTRRIPARPEEYYEMAKDGLEDTLPEYVKSHLSDEQFQPFIKDVRDYVEAVYGREYADKVKTYTLEQCISLDNIPDPEDIRLSTDFSKFTLWTKATFEVDLTKFKEIADKMMESPQQDMDDAR